MVSWLSLTKMKELCIKIFNDYDTKAIIELENIIEDARSRELIKSIQQDLLATFYLVLRNESQNGKPKLKIDNKIRVIKSLSVMFSYINLENEIVFFNFFGFLLQDIYDSETNRIKPIQEEHKLGILSCVKSLLNSTNSDLMDVLYSKKNGKRLCKMIYVAVEIALHEKYRALRIEAIECLMAIYKVHSDNDYGDPFYRRSVAETLSFFLPGVASCLHNVALKDEKVGFKLIQIAIKAWGRILSLLMQDYTANAFSMSSLEYAKSIALSCLNQQSAVDMRETKTNKMEEYLEDIRNPRWFSKSDIYVSNMINGFRKLTQHQSKDIRKELAEMCYLFIENCTRTMPISHRYIVDILIILSEDEDSDVSQLSRKGIEKLTLLVSDGSNQILFNKMQDGFYDIVSQMPGIFNGIDDQEKLAILKLASGYINLFGKNILLHDGFRELLHILLHLCEFEIHISTFNRITIQDLENDEAHSSLWKNLKFLKNESVRLQFTNLCHTMVINDVFQAVTDFLTDFFLEEGSDIEATYLLNETISGLKSMKGCNKRELIKPLLHLYIYPENWNMPISNQFDGNLPLKTLNHNTQKGALVVSGIGIMADVLQEDFRPFLLKSLFLVLTRAGSNCALIQAAGRRALNSIANALKYPNVTALINDNMDYFVFYIERNLKNNDIKGDAFNVMEIVMTYGNKDTLDNLLNIVQEVLLQSCDKFKETRIDTYLKIFKIFLKSLLKWFNITLPSRVIVTKAQKEEEEIRKFKVNGLENIEEITDFSDNIMDKSAEELYREDMDRKENDKEDNLESEVEEYKKPEPPNHIKLTVAILKRSLNFLPSNDKDRKLLVLEILRDGLELIKEFEDELLPIVHLIWHPLVGRFKEIDHPVIINYSFLLLSTMARVSKEFIRMRTAKDVLPSIMEVLKKTSKESYLKDRGSAYRYTQSYKLQAVMLESLAYLVTDLGLMEKEMSETCQAVISYLSDKQPLPLQREAVKFFKLIISYDMTFQNKIKDLFEDKSKMEYEKNFNRIFEDNEDSCVN